MLNGILSSAISGINANAQRVASVADNVANISTKGYKRTTVQTTTVVTSKSTQATRAYSAGGVQTNVRQHNDVQGLLAASTSPTDLGVSGAGFFPVGHTPRGGETLYTRDGSFKPDENGNLVNASGLYLRGFTPGGEDLGPVNINHTNGTAEATTSVRVGANLPADAAPGESYTINAQVTDSLGNPVAVNLDFEAQADGSYRLSINDVTNLATGESLGPAQEGDASGDPYQVDVLVEGELTKGFDVNGDGIIDSATPPGIYIPSGTSSSFPLQIELDLEGLTRYSGDFTLGYTQADGAAYGTQAGVSVGADGTVTATFDNGARRAIAEVPVVTFSNPGGLEAVSGNAYRETDASGAPTVRTPGEGGAGTVQGGALELSTVNPAQDFVTLITAQTAYRAGLEVVRTAEQMSHALLDVQG